MNMLWWGLRTEILSSNPMDPLAAPATPKVTAEFEMSALPLRTFQFVDGASIANSEPDAGLLKGDACVMSVVDITIGIEANLFNYCRP